MSSKNDIEWENLFNKYNILKFIEKEGEFKISSRLINEFREARLMTKIDHELQLPSIFKDNNLSILPITRGDYVISDFKAFHKFNKISDKKNDFGIIQIPPYESIDYNNIFSESIALNCAYISNIISKFVDDEEMKPTVNGRMSSQSFDFKIDTSKSQIKEVKVRNSQIEIDGGYEGLNTLCLFEAKNVLSDDFLIRQLYYPYRLWKNKVSKKVKTIFLTYSNGIFHLREYVFEDLYFYNSIQLIKEKKYVFKEEAINLETIQSILYKTSIVEEPQVPFPQADSFERVINLCELLSDKLFINNIEVTDNYEFVKRQTDYYTNAAMYLGLIEKISDNSQISYCLTKRGKALFELTIRERQLEFIKLILSHLVFKKTLELYLEKSEPPKINEIIQIMKDSNLHNIKSDTTFKRRASTISSWIDWIINLIEE